MTILNIININAFYYNNNNNHYLLIIILLLFTKFLLFPNDILQLE